MTEERKEKLMDEFKSEIRMYQSSGWELKSNDPEGAKLTKNEASTTGHVLIFIFLGWYTFLIPNIIYHIVKKKTKTIPRPY